MSERRRKPQPVKSALPHIREVVRGSAIVRIANEFHFGASVRVLSKKFHLSATGVENVLRAQFAGR